MNGIAQRSDPPPGASPSMIRRLARDKEFDRPTGSLAPGYTQANIVIVPAEVADAFEAYTRVNAQACPLVARGRPGDPALPTLGSDIDIRTDLPRYRVFRCGRPVAKPRDILDFWRDDLVTFALGCSLTFEADVVHAGVRLRSHAPGVTCSAFVSSIPTAPAGPFAGPLAVTMRAIRRDQVDLVRRITEAHPQAHGPPVHIGDPAAIGVDLDEPIDGIGLTDVREDEVAVFWACGVTPQLALERAKLLLAITHAPGHMLVTDVPAEALGWD